jgi:hypothetical protein
LINWSILFDRRLSPTELAEELTGELKPSFGTKRSLAEKASGFFTLSGAQLPER